jgi:transcriptional regulator with XRE-family HTH domain
MCCRGNDGKRSFTYQEVKRNQMITTGERLREERERLGLTQPAFAAVGGVTKMSQINYEKGDRKPDSAYLTAIAAIGADVFYILTGRRSLAPLTPDELELLERFRAASLEGKAAAIGALLGAATAGTKINVGSNHGQVVKGALKQTGSVVFGGTYKEGK